MAKAWKTCRVCGKEYEACRSMDRAAGVFRWQEVACSPECGAVYLQQIQASRGTAQPIKTTPDEVVADDAGAVSTIEFAQVETGDIAEI
jgi:hypothetical protein